MHVVFALIKRTAINEGDRLVVLGDDAEGIALVKADVFEQRVQEALKLSRQMTNE